VIAVLNWSLDHWWVIFWLFVFGVFEGVRDFFLGIVEAIGGIAERRHQRRVKELKLQARIAAAPAHPAGKKPGHCVHRNVVPIVIAATEEVAGWLCKTCEARLDADWAVREEDL
jgi:hypothetical protein